MKILLLKSRFSQALLWSLSFHLGLLLIFSVSSFFLPSAPLSQQIDIQLDFSSPISLTSLEVNTNEHPCEMLLETYCLRSNHLTDSTLLACTTGSETTPLIRSYTAPQLPWEAGDGLLKPPPKAYPMKITLQKGLQSLILTQDASDLFKTLTDDMSSYIPIFPDSLPRLSFQVTINRKEGRVIKIDSEREFTDKRLQRLAEKVLQEIRFQPTEGASEECVRGEIMLQFASAFDSMSQQLIHPGAFL